MAQPNAYYARTLLVARDADGVVGCAEVGGSLQDNTHLADLEIHVLPWAPSARCRKRPPRRRSAPVP